MAVNYSYFIDSLHYYLSIFYIFHSKKLLLCVQKVLLVCGITHTH